MQSVKFKWNVWLLMTCCCIAAVTVTDLLGGRITRFLPTTTASLLASIMTGPNPGPGQLYRSHTKHALKWNCTKVIGPLVILYNSSNHILSANTTSTWNQYYYRWNWNPHIKDLEDKDMQLNTARIARIILTWLLRCTGFWCIIRSMKDGSSYCCWLLQ